MKCRCSTQRRRAVKAPQGGRGDSRQARDARLARDARGVLHRGLVPSPRLDSFLHVHIAGDGLLHPRERHGETALRLDPSCHHTRVRYMGHWKAPSEYLPLALKATCSSRSAVALPSHAWRPHPRGFAYTKITHTCHTGMRRSSPHW